jgi:hypothetical protein
MRDHEIAALVSKLRDAAIQYRDAQQLRAVIGGLVVPSIRAAYAAGMTRAAEICDETKFKGYAPPEIGAAADYYNDAARNCADDIRAEITKDQV